MKNNLFVKLHKYPSSGKVTPEENYFTELFSWVLEKNPDLTIKLFKEVFKIKLDKNYSVKTQVSYLNSFIDVQIEDGKNLIFLENKLSAELNQYNEKKSSAEKSTNQTYDQIEKYQRVQAEIEKENKQVFALVLSKKNYVNHPDSNIFIEWSQIYDFIKNYCQKVENKEVIEMFLEFMEYKSMASFQGFKSDFFNYLVDEENSNYDGRVIKKTFEDFVNSINSKLKQQSQKDWSSKIYSKGVDGNIYAHFTYPNSYNFNINVDISLSGMSVHLYFPLWSTGVPDKENEKSKDLVKNSELIKSFKSDKNLFLTKMNNAIKALDSTFIIDLYGKQYFLKNKDIEKTHPQNEISTKIFSINSGSENILNKQQPNWFMDSEKLILDTVKNKPTEFFKPEQHCLSNMLEQIHQYTLEDNKYCEMSRFFLIFKKMLPIKYLIKQEIEIIDTTCDIINDFSQIIEIMSEK